MNKIVFASYSRCNLRLIQTQVKYRCSCRFSVVKLRLQNNFPCGLSNVTVWSWGPTAGFMVKTPPFALVIRAARKMGTIRHFAPGTDSLYVISGNTEGSIDSTSALEFQLFLFIIFYSLLLAPPHLHFLMYFSLLLIFIGILEKRPLLLLLQWSGRLFKLVFAG